MPAPAPVSKPQTIKQAKAAFKSRGRPSLSEREQKQLDRALELDRRAARAREAEKRKVEAAKKRAEKEKKDKEINVRAQLGSQRRCDRFGYKSSQMHLGAFLNRNNTEKSDQKENLSTMAEYSEDEDFGDGVDDESVLEALDGCTDASLSTAGLLDNQTKVQDGISASHCSQSTSDRPITIDGLATLSAELECFWDEMASSTQIARDLSAVEPSEKEPNALQQARSFASDDFDLTVEDIEELHCSPSLVDKALQDRKLMPPPPLPAKRSTVVTGFTLSELESFVDDDLQLTQAEPG